MVIVFCGGGTGGSVSPLLAVAEKLKKKDPKLQFFWIGTKKGPERKLVTSQGIRFYRIFSGKLRRYFSWRNFIDPFLILIALVQSLFILKRLKPALVIGAGSYVSVPVGLAAWLLRIPLFIHQLDIQPGLANKILAFFAVKISVSFEPALKSFPEQKAILIGCPVREEIMVGDRLKAKEMLNLEDGLPTVLAIGGGTGSLRMNQIIIGALPELLSFCQVIHITGRNKKLPPLALKGKRDRYHCFEFVISELPDIMASADLVITRGGIGFLSELSALGKPSLIIPLPDSHQVVNANYFSSRGAAVTLDQEALSSQSLVADIKELLSDKSSLRYLSQKMLEIYNSQAADLLADQVLKIIKDNEV